MHAASSVGKPDFSQTTYQKKIFERIRPDLRTDLVFDAADAVMRGDKLGIDTASLDVEKMQQAVSK